jgi:hypothetical protein
VILGGGTAGESGLVRGFDFDDIVGGAFSLAGMTDANIAGFFAKMSEVFGAEVAHSALNSAS